MNITRQALAVSALPAIIAFTCFACSEESGKIDTRCFDLALEYSDLVCACEEWEDYCECITEDSFYDFLADPIECVDVDTPEECEENGVSPKLLKTCECMTSGMSWNPETEQREVYYLTCNSELVTQFHDLIDNFECPLYTTQCIDLADEYLEMVYDQCPDWVALFDCEDAGEFYNYVELQCVADCDDILDVDLKEECQCFMESKLFNYDTDECEYDNFSCTDEIYEDIQELIDDFGCPDLPWAKSVT